MDGRAERLKASLSTSIGKIEGDLRSLADFETAFPGYPDGSVEKMHDVQKRMVERAKAASVVLKQISTELARTSKSANTVFFSDEIDKLQGLQSKCQASVDLAKLLSGGIQDKDKLLECVQACEQHGVTLSLHCRVEVWRLRGWTAYQYNQYPEFCDLLMSSHSEVIDAKLGSVTLC